MRVDRRRAGERTYTPRLEFLFSETQLDSPVSGADSSTPLRSTRSKGEYMADPGTHPFRSSFQKRKLDLGVLGLGERGMKELSQVKDCGFEGNVEGGLRNSRWASPWGRKIPT